MGGITSSVGIFSGINSAQLIDQLLSIEARPKQLAQNRLLQLQQQQAAVLDINSRITALKNAAAGFRENNPFQAKSATSSSDATLTATAQNSAPSGTYTFVVDRLVSTQQLLSRGFANRDASGVGASSISFESSAARLDRDVDLSELNGGAGVSRGKMVVTDSGGRQATIDLSRSTKVSEVLSAINSNGTAQVSATVKDGKFIITDNAGGNVTIANDRNSTTATSLGLAGVAATNGVVTGNSVYYLSGATTLGSLNDGRGVSTKMSTTSDSYNFIINVGGDTPQAVKVNIGDVYGTGDNSTTKIKGAVSDMGGVVTRINEALAAANVSTVSASIDQTNGRLLITSTSGTNPVTITEGTDTTAADLGLTTAPVSGSIQGRRILAGMQTTLVRGLKGGNMAANDGLLNIRLKTDDTFSVNVNTGGSVQDMLTAIEEASKVSGTKRVSATLDSNGTGITITDLSGGNGTFYITGTEDNDAAAALGISTGETGTTSGTVRSGNMQRQYMSRATSISSLNNGRGIGTGEFRMIDSVGTSVSVNITENIKSMGELIDLINSRGARIKASINANGDGISLSETIGEGETAGAQRIKVEDVSGTAGKSLNLIGQATGTGNDNKIDGSFERVITFSNADTLQQVTDKINAAKIGVNANIVRDGSGSAPFRLSLSATNTGSAGRFIIDSGSLDLGFQRLDEGQDARVFFGSSDAAMGVAVSSSTNTIDTVIPGVKIDLKSVSNTPVNLTVASDTARMESAIQTFISTFNTVISRIETQTKYDKETNRKSPLTGDGTTLEIRQQLFSTLQGRARGSTGSYSTFAEIGINVGTGGTLALDTTRLREAMTNDPASVEALFTARVAVDDTKIDVSDGITVRNTRPGSTFSTLGVMGQIEQLARRYVDGNDAVLGSKQDQLRNQVTLQQSRIVNFDVRIAARRSVLERQFQAMESAIGKLQTQQNSLGSIKLTG